MDQMEAAEEMVNAAVQKSAEGYLLNIKGLEQDIEELKDRQSSEHSLREVNDPGIQVIEYLLLSGRGRPDERAPPYFCSRLSTSGSDR